MKGLERKLEHYSSLTVDMKGNNMKAIESKMEHIEIDRETAIEHLLESWAAHYEMMDSEYLAKQYKSYVSQDIDNTLLTIEITD